MSLYGVIQWSANRAWYFAARSKELQSCKKAHKMYDEDKADEVANNLSEKVSEAVRDLDRDATIHVLEVLAEDIASRIEKAKEWHD
jgi:Zn-finger protein